MISRLHLFAPAQFARSVSKSAALAEAVQKNFLEACDFFPLSA
jgi:hypothetical protein